MIIAEAFPGRVRAPMAADWALSRGISALTTPEVADLLGAPATQVSQRLASAIRRTEWVTPARGLWVPVPPEYRGWGGPPAVEFLGALMRYFEADYYLGWLSAAALFGAAHHAPQVTQVATSRLVRDRQVGRVRLQFHTRSNLHLLPTTAHLARSGPVRVSIPEVTALDLAADLSVSGGLDNVATVIVDLADQAGLEVPQMTELAQHYSPAVGRRLGWILDEFTEVEGLDMLQKVVAAVAPTPSLLDSLSPSRGAVSHRWNVRINTEVEVDA